MRSAGAGVSPVSTAPRAVLAMRSALPSVPIRQAVAGATVRRRIPPGPSASAEKLVKGRTPSALSRSFSSTGPSRSWATVMRPRSASAVTVQPSRVRVTGGAAGAAEATPTTIAAASSGDKVRMRPPRAAPGSRPRRGRRRDSILQWPAGRSTTSAKVASSSASAERWAARSRAKRPPEDRSSAAVPRSATRPRSSTRTSSKPSRPSSRCVTRSVARPSPARRISSRICLSVTVSRWAVGSSSSSSGPDLSSARARARRWRSPPDSRWPSSPTQVSSPAGSRSASAPRRTRSSTSRSAASVASGWARRRFSARVPVNTCAVWPVQAIDPRTVSPGHDETSTPR